jgi:hypothetical protein
MGKNNPCNGCFHYYGAFRANRCCNYIFDEDACRGCPADNCDKKIGIEEAKRRGMKRKALFTV